MKKELRFLLALIALPVMASAQLSFNSTSVITGATDRAAVDMNGDGLEDIVAVSATTVYIKFQQPGNQGNTGGSSNNDSSNFVTQSYTVAGGQFSSSWSLAAGDFNKDGLNDLAYGSSSGVQILTAVNSDGDPEPDAFVLESISTTVFTQRVNFVDINRDGHLDIFVCDDVAPNEYFINDGSNNLLNYEGAQYDYPNGCQGSPPPTEIDSVGVYGGLGNYCSGGNYGSVWIDYNNDRNIDMFLAKCGGSSARRTNQLFESNGDVGPETLEFSEVASSVGLADDVQTWSSAWADYDNDGDMDCFVGAYSSDDHKFMENIKSPGAGNNPDTYSFTDETLSWDVDNLTATGVESTPHDFNNDGFVDILVNGNLLINNGDKTFTVQSSGAGAPPSGAVADLNDDGLLDVFVSNIYYNTTATSNNWIKINTIGTTSNKNGIGARVEINSTGVGNQIRDVRSGEGFRYMSSLKTHFGLAADAMINTITVYWPSGIIDILTNVPANQTLDIVEGDHTLGTQETEVDDLILYPNPTKGILNINSTYGFENAVYSVFDMTGRLILNKRFSSETIDVSQLSTGNYILRIVDKGAIKTQKFIKQ